jgi:hypothetical protein
MIENYNGTSWSVVISPYSGTLNLNSIACVSSTNCWAVGYEWTGTSDVTFIQHFDGSLWKRATSPDVTGSTGDQLNGVACVSATDCWAAGFDGIAGTQTLVEVFDGSSWQIASTPNTGVSDRFWALACFRAPECWAVGGYSNGTVFNTLIEQHADATTTAVSCAPNPDPATHATTCTASVVDQVVASLNPSGTVSWTGGKGTYSSKKCRLASGTCSVTFTPALGSPATQTISARYSGDANHFSSKAAATLQVT